MLAGIALCRARALTACGARLAGAAARVEQGSRAVRVDRGLGAARVSRARRQDIVARRDGLDRGGAWRRQQRFGADACGCRVRRTASRRVRLDQPRAHAAVERARAGAVAQARDRARMFAVFRSRLPLRSYALPGRDSTRAGRIRVVAVGDLNSELQLAD